MGRERVGSGSIFLDRANIVITGIRFDISARLEREDLGLIQGHVRNTCQYFPMEKTAMHLAPSSACLRFHSDEGNKRNSLRRS